MGVNLGNLNACQGDVQSDINGKLTLNNTPAQGMAGGNMAQAIAGGSNPYVASVIKGMTANPNGSVNK